MAALTKKRLESGQLSIYMLPRLSTRVLALARQNKRSFSQMITILVEEALDARDALTDGDPAEDDCLVSAAHSPV